MTNPANPGQPPGASTSQPARGALHGIQTLQRAVESLASRGFIDVEPLVDDYRALAPLGHPRATDDGLDLGFLGGALALGGLSLLGASHVVVTRGTPRGGLVLQPTPDPSVVELAVPPAPDAAADALALVTGLALEARKVAALLDARTVDGGALAILARGAGLDEARFADALGLDVEHAPRALAALLGGGAHRTLHLGHGIAHPTAAAPVDLVMLDAILDAGGPLFVVAGATERLHDVVSPYARRLGPSLSRLAGAASDDARYDTLPLLYAEEPGALDERLSVETRDGIARAGAALVLRFDAIDPHLADPRTKEPLRALKKSRARAVLCGRHPETLAGVLEATGEQTRAVVLLSEGFIHDDDPIAYPELVEDAGTGHFIELDNAFSSSKETRPRAGTTLASLGLAPASAPLVDTLQFPLLNQALAARAAGHLSRKARLAAAVTQAGAPEASTTAALLCLSRMAATQEGAPARPFPRGR